MSGSSFGTQYSCRLIGRSVPFTSGPDGRTVTNCLRRRADWVCVRPAERLTGKWCSGNVRSSRTDWSRLAIILPQRPRRRMTDVILRRRWRWWWWWWRSSWSWTVATAPYALRDRSFSTTCFYCFAASTLQRAHERKQSGAYWELFFDWGSKSWGPHFEESIHLL